MQPVLQPLLDAVEQAGDFEELRERLDQAALQMDLSVVQDQLTRALFYQSLAAQVADFAEIEPKEALTYFRQKGLAQSFDSNSLHQSSHATAFTAAGIMQTDVLEDMREFIDEAIEKGTSFEDFQKGLIPRLQQKGWWGKKTIVDPETGESREIDINPQRLKRMFETNMRVTHAQWVRIQARKKAFPFLIYGGSSSVENRPEHEKLVGTILPVDDPIWEQIRPVKAWGCKHRIRALTKSQAERQGYTGQPAPKLKMVKHTHPRTGEEQLVPEGVEPAFYYPNGTWLGNLKKQLDERERPDLPVSRALQKVIDQPPLVLQLAGIEQTLAAGTAETVYLLRSDGALLARLDGSHDVLPTAAVPATDRAESIATSRHADDALLQLDDVATAIALNLQEIRVVSAGKVYVMSRPADGWVSIEQIREQYEQQEQSGHHAWLAVAEALNLPYRVLELD